MFNNRENSPWGKVQTCDALCPGVFLVSTASHGGTLVSKEVSAMLSSAARMLRSLCGKLPVIWVRMARSQNSDSLLPMAR